MRPGVITTASPSDAENVLAIITLAFSADPFARWLYPDPHQYVTAWPALNLAYCKQAFELGTAHRIDGGAGAALWLGPGVHPDEIPVLEILQRSVDSSVRDAVYAILGLMASFQPTEAHWYLPVIGVDPRQQGQGLGSALLQHALAQVDRDHLPAYLVSSNPRNNPLYARHGFEQLDTIREGSSPALFPMLRERR